MKVGDLKENYHVSKIYIFWPRPLLITNINGDTIKDYEINLKHYINAEGNMLKDEKVKLHIAPLNLGFWFEVESFSPSSSATSSLRAAWKAPTRPAALAAAIIHHTMARYSRCWFSPLRPETSRSRLA